MQSSKQFLLAPSVPNTKTVVREDLIKGILSNLNSTARDYGIELQEESYDLRFKELIEKLSKIGKIVILIDEYDKPIIDQLTKPELAIEMREILKGFYTIIKASDEYIRFALLNGCSAFFYLRDRALGTDPSFVSNRISYHQGNPKGSGQLCIGLSEL